MDIHTFRKTDIVKHNPDFLSDFCNLSGVISSKYLYTSAISVQHTEHQLYERTLSRTVLAEQSEYLAGADFKGYVAVGPDRTVALADVFQTDERRSGTRALPCRRGLRLCHDLFPFDREPAAASESLLRRCAPSSGRSSMKMKAETAVMRPTAMKVACRA